MHSTQYYKPVYQAQILTKLIIQTITSAFEIPWHMFGDGIQIQLFWGGHSHVNAMEMLMCIPMQDIPIC